MYFSTLHSVLEQYWFLELCSECVHFFLSSLVWFPSWAQKHACFVLLLFLVLDGQWRLHSWFCNCWFSSSFCLDPRCFSHSWCKVISSTVFGIAIVLLPHHMMWLYLFLIPWELNKHSNFLLMVRNMFVHHLPLCQYIARSHHFLCWCSVILDPQAMRKSTVVEVVDDKLRKRDGWRIWVINRPSIGKKARFLHTSCCFQSFCHNYVIWTGGGSCGWLKKALRQILLALFADP